RTVEAQVFIDNPFDHPNDSFHVDIFADDNNYHVTITDEYLNIEPNIFCLRNFEFNQ
ncbi:unnamed protein product, partial [Rotaria sp. Silwood1]